MSDGVQKAFMLQHIEREFDENEKIRGNLGRFDDGRLVFVGERADNKNE